MIIADSVEILEGAAINSFLSDPIITGGRTRLGEALQRTRDEIYLRYSNTVAVKYYLVSDLKVSQSELVALQDLLRQTNVQLTIYARRSWIDETLVESYPEILRAINWLPQ